MHIEIKQMDQGFPAESPDSFNRKSTTPSSQNLEYVQFATFTFNLNLQWEILSFVSRKKYWPGPSINGLSLEVKFTCSPFKSSF